MVGLPRGPVATLTSMVLVFVEFSRVPSSSIVGAGGGDADSSVATSVTLVELVTFAMCLTFLYIGRSLGFGFLFSRSLSSRAARVAASGQYHLFPPTLCDAEALSFSRGTMWSRPLTYPSSVSQRSRRCGRSFALNGFENEQKDGQKQNAIKQTEKNRRYSVSVRVADSTSMDTDDDVMMTVG